MKKIYICHTIYHLYISLIKQIIQKDRADIVLSDSITEYWDVYEKIKKNNFFSNVHIVREKNIYLSNSKKTILDKLKGNKGNINYTFNEITVDFNQYDEIYIFNDRTKIGVYLISNKIRYNLIEDGLDTLKNIDKIGFIGYSIFNKISDLLNSRVIFFGQSKYCKSIEVNSKDELKIPNKKVLEVPREDILNKINNEEKMNIYNFFMSGRNIELEDKENVILILTQPLFQDGLVNSEKRQIDIYKKIVSENFKDDVKIVIKPHPRDNVTYNFNDCMIIDKLIPIEVLNFNKRIRVRKVIAVFSTAVYGIDFAEEKINLGIQYINNAI